MRSWPHDMHHHIHLRTSELRLHLYSYDMMSPHLGHTCCAGTSRLGVSTPAIA